MIDKKTLITVIICSAIAALVCTIDEIRKDLLKKEQEKLIIEQLNLHQKYLEKIVKVMQNIDPEATKALLELEETKK